MCSRPSLPWTRCGAPIAATCNAVVCDAAGSVEPSDAAAIAAIAARTHRTRTTGLTEADYTRSKLTGGAGTGFTDGGRAVGARGSDCGGRAPGRRRRDSERRRGEEEHRVEELRRRAAVRPRPGPAELGPVSVRLQGEASLCHRTSSPVTVTNRCCSPRTYATG